MGVQKYVDETKKIHTKKLPGEKNARRKNAGRKKTRRKYAGRKSADEKMADENMPHEKMFAKLTNMADKMAPPVDSRQKNGKFSVVSCEICEGNGSACKHMLYIPLGVKFNIIAAYFS